LPGRNLTGITLDPGIEIWGKRLELLKEAVPWITSTAFLSMREGWEGSFGQAMWDIAGRLGISLISMLPSAGTLAATAVKAAARKARKAAAKRLPRPVKRAANTIAKAAKAPKKTAKKTSRKSKNPAKSSGRRKNVGNKTATRVAKKKKARRR
jgi:hypothetical protein